MYVCSVYDCYIITLLFVLYTTIIPLQNAIAVPVGVVVLQRVPKLLLLHPLLLRLYNWYCVPNIPSGIYMLSEAVWRYSMSWPGTGRDSSGSTPSVEASNNGSGSNKSSWKTTCIV